MLCMKCGMDNIDNTSGYCLYCNAKLPPSSFYNVVQSPKQETGRMDAVKKYCDSMKAGTITKEVFGNYISSTYYHLVDLSSGIYETVDSENYLDSAPDEVNAGYEGMQLWEGGLTEIYLYVEDDDISHIDNGFAMIEHGNELINKAMVLNRDLRNTEGIVGTL